MNAAFGMLSIGFILPAAACDFKMTTEDKGHLTVSTMLGKSTQLIASELWLGCVFIDINECILFRYVVGFLFLGLSR